MTDRKPVEHLPATADGGGSPSRIAVIGAGIAGLAAARSLRDRGNDVVVIDKGRGPGGRASSRRSDGFRFDHGAQYFTARDPRFRREVDAWLAAGIAARWTPRLEVFEARGEGAGTGGERDRFVGVPDMSAVAVHLARGLDLRSGLRAERLERSGGEWCVLDGAGAELAVADTVLVAAPPANAIPLLANAPDLAERARRAVIRPCWAVLLGFAEPLPLEFDAAFVNAGPLSWAARNASKPGRPDGEAWVLHGSGEWSEANLERESAEVIDLLLGEFSARCAGGDLPAPIHASAHRWRYAQPDPALAEPCLWDGDLRLGAAGDWLGGPKVEGAYLGGLALADLAG